MRRIGVFMNLAADDSEGQARIAAFLQGLQGFGTLLGLSVSPWFLAVPLFVGAGLLCAGFAGICGMARLLQ